MQDRNIVLIGMPGAGKSTIGVLLAKTLGMSFIDSDLLIQREDGRLLQEIIDNDGIGKFLKIEEDVILKLKVDNCVIATGGSVIYSDISVNHLKNNGRLIYLKLKYSDIEQRINNMSGRGIVIRQGQRLNDLFNERIILYEKYADVIVDCSNTTIEDVVRMIANIIKSS
jgi:shikimate kinase